MSSQRRGQACKFFNTAEGCRFGDQCRFSHAASEKGQPLLKHGPRGSTVRRDFRDGLHKWVCYIPNTQSAPPLLYNLTPFLAQAHELVTQDAGDRQAVIERLSTEGGLCRINEIVTNIEHAQDKPESYQTALFTKQVLRLFRILSHKDVVSSLLLERYVDTICNFLFGVGGHRSVKIFAFVARIITLQCTASGCSEVVDALEVCATVLCKIVDLNGSAMITHGFDAILESFQASLLTLEESIGAVVLDNIRASLQKIQRRLGLGTAFSEARLPEKTQSMQPTFRLKREGPGMLSESGRRHDNDFEQIHDIRILPTASELQTQRNEYLPSTDISQFHIPGIQGLVDRQFRLLREDTIGCLRDAVRNVMDTSSHNRSATRTYTYQEALLLDIRLDTFNGVELLYQFGQPEIVRTLSIKARRDWWAASKRLQQGALVCLLDFRNTPMFCSVVGTGLAPAETMNTKKPVASSLNVYENPEAAFVAVNLVESNHTSLDQILGGFITGHGRGSEMLIEFPGVLLPSFFPSLQALQRIHQTGDLQFSDILMPVKSSDGKCKDVEPPGYSQKGGFRFDLSCITNGHPLSLSARESFDFKTLRQHSTLDEAQASSLFDALTRKLALIQGPPGTGKSYVGINIIKVLLQNASKAALGPIICVCYTNHALDQLLEHLVDHGVEQIIRIGSRSKSKKLEKLNLTHVVRAVERTALEKRTGWQSAKEMEQLLQLARNLFRQFLDAESPELIKAHLLNRNPSHCDQLFGRDIMDEDGFQEIRYHSKSPIKDWLDMRMSSHVPRTHQVRSPPELESVSLLSMTYAERRVLFGFWVQQSRATLKSQLDFLLNSYLQTRIRIKQVRNEVDLRCLQQATVIGVTTNGMTRVMDLLQRLKAKVMLVEEAGEVLEAHSLASFPSSIEHAILIGDHLQLRPQINRYDLSCESGHGKQYSLDVSLFERLVHPFSQDTPAIQFSTLQTQRRMHPSISELIRMTCYRQLQDAANVEQYPEVPGLMKRLFWLDHEHSEVQRQDGDILLATSHSNDFEVKMTAALVSHLVKQGVYKSQDIAVLTPYLGQLRKLRQELSQMFNIVLGEQDLSQLEDLDADIDLQLQDNPQTTRTILLNSVRVATVDNFQGEEAKVVVISLVRCNEENKCGFLRTPNRINVLLSRAKHGMYIIGNAETYGHVEMWASVLETLQENGNLGKTLALTCSRHPETPIHVKTPDDFLIHSPEGGCDLKCTKRLSCGHACINRCHSDVLHQAVRCLEPCTRQIRGCKVHSCPEICGDPCPSKCVVGVDNVRLPCGHTQQLQCHEAQDLNQAKCHNLINWGMDDCEHTIQIKCYERKNPNAIICNAQCGVILSCGHSCRRKCFECRKEDTRGMIKVDHLACVQICERMYTTCNHYCTETCHGDNPCRLCPAPCEVRCAHSACSKKCHEPCPPCANERCSSHCPHSCCDMPCGVPCDWIPCEKRCDSRLPCGCQCPSICGEACPSEKYCQNCCSDDIKDMEVDFFVGEKYRDIDLDEDPIIIPQCGHIYTRSSMDGVMDMPKHYAIDDHGTIQAIKSASEPFSSDDMKRCPKCRGSLRNLSRYGRMVRRSLLDESTKRFIVLAHRDHIELESRVSEQEGFLCNDEVQRALHVKLYLSGTRGVQIKALSRLPVFSSVNKKAFSLHRDISTYIKRVAEEEQPYKQVRNMIDLVRRRKGTVREDFSDEILTVQMQHYLLGTVLLLRFELLLLSTAVKLVQKDLNNTPLTEGMTCIRVDFSANLKDCDILAAESKEANQPRAEAETHLLFARYAAVQCSVLDHRPTTDDAQKADTQLSISELRDQAFAHLQSARDLCARYVGSTRGLTEEVDAVERMLAGSWYEPVSSDERRLVLIAMQAEFTGTGHWYYCVNGHPFTIGECGMPMQQTRCPQCEAPIGGQHHQAVQGVRHAEDLDAELANMHI